MKFSCIHTLAQKRRSTLKSVITKQGKDIKLKYIESTEIIDKDTGIKQKKSVEKEKQLLTWEDCKQIMTDILYSTRAKQKGKKQDSISITSSTVDEICNVKINWRTKYKLTKHCSICGSENKVEYHHVKHIRKGKVTGFLQ